MNDTTKCLIDSAKLIIGTSSHTNDSTANINTHTILDKLTNFITNPWVYIILIPFGLALLVPLIIEWYSGQFKTTPKLYLKMGNPLFGQRTSNSFEKYELTWIYECTLKNNSEFNAYNILIKELKPIDIEDRIISNHIEICEKFPPNNNIDARTEISFIIKKTIILPQDIFINITIEDGRKVMHPGTKIKNPEIDLMPSVLNNINLIISYDNKIRKRFYSRFTRINNQEVNEISTRKFFNSNNWI